MTCIKNVFIFLLFWFALFMHMDPDTLEVTSWRYWFFAILFFIWVGGGIVKLLLELRSAVHEFFHLLECRLRGIPVPYDAGSEERG